MSIQNRDETEQARKLGGASVDTEIFGKIRLPAEYFLDRQNFNTAVEVKKLHAPLLLIAGQNDQLVAAASVRRTFEAANEPKQFLEFPTDHFYERDPKIPAQVNAVTVTFFREHLC